MRRSRILAAVLGSALLCGMALNASAQETDAVELAESDPIEPFNRGIFWFNDRLDVFLFEPLGKGWKLITPKAARDALERLFTNLRFPVRLVGSLLQGELVNAGEETGRFVVNSTVGIVGLFDPATAWGLELHDEDFGQALGHWGTPPGPYLVLPIFGPSNARDALGQVVDLGLQSGPSLASAAAGTALSAVDLVNSRALVLEEIRQAKQASLDFYVFVRNAYVQLRRMQVQNGELPKEDPVHDLYEIEDE